jgi:hypothetical protein
MSRPDRVRVLVFCGLVLFVVVLLVTVARLAWPA